MTLPDVTGQGCANGCSEYADDRFGNKEPLCAACLDEKDESPVVVNRSVVSLTLPVAVTALVDGTT